MSPRLNRTVPSPQKLRQRCSAPAIITIRQSRSGSDSTLVNPSPSTPATPPPLPSDFPVTKITKREGEADASQGSRASAPIDPPDSDRIGPYQVLDAWQDGVAGAMKEIKAVQNMEWAERLARAVVEAKAAKDEEWADRLEKAVAQAEAAKDNELEAFDQFKESNHTNATKDLEEDQEYEMKELEEKHNEILEELTTKNAEALQQLTKEYGAEARRLELRRVQGAKEVKKLKEDLIEMEAEKMTTEKRLVHMTGQRDALHKAFAAMTGRSPSQDIEALEPSQSDQCLNNRREEVEVNNEIADQDFLPAINVGADSANNIETPATDCGSLQPDPQGQKTQMPITPNPLYSRLRLVENENVQLHADLERRHEDVTYLIGKTDSLRALLEEDAAKADTYADTMLHKEVIEDLRNRLTQSYEAAERERFEVQRLCGQIDIVTADMEREKLERQLAVKDKEIAWEQNKTLLQNLKGTFGKSDFDTAFWAHYESLAKEKGGLEGELSGYKRQRRNMMEEAVELKVKIAKLELGAPKGDDGFQDLKSQVLMLQVDKDVLRAELDFQLAEQTNRQEGQQMPQGLRDIQDQVLERKNAEIAQGRAMEEGGHGRDIQPAEELEACADTPKSDYGFF